MNNAISFNAIDALIFLLVFGLIIFLNARIKRNFASVKLNRFFYAAWGFKVAFAFLFALVYLFVLGGGDINAYWEGASCLGNLFYTNPEAYFSEMWHTQREYGIAHHFNVSTGYPPGWIWREEEAWMATKIISVFAIITWKGFWSATLVIASLSFWSSWLLATKLQSVEKFNRNSVLFALLFFPSVSFWCSGISKDSLAFTASIFLIFQFFLLLKWGGRLSFVRIILIFLLLLMVYSLRHYLAYALFVPFLLAILARYGNRFSGRPVLLWGFRIIVFSAVAFSFTLVLSSNQTKELIFEANITKSDFSANPIYTGAKYDMPTSSGNPVELVTLFPLALFTALFRPSFLDSVGASFLMNQLESAILLFLTLRFIFNRKLIINLNRIVRHEFMLYALIFVVIVGFMAGYSSILFGVLVRIRAILIKREIPTITC
ncbi:MAG: hypothetical protein EB023_03565 [Flavobacteriia bacterium]|nr:hypothetical protein [Flavobacteriia bacterium]